MTRDKDKLQELEKILGVKFDIEKNK